MPLRQQFYVRWMAVFFAVAIPLQAALLIAWWAGTERVSAGDWGRAALLCIGALCAALAGGFLASRRFALATDAVRELVVQASQGNHENRLASDVRPIVEPLAQALDQMQEHLKARFSELQSRRDQLQTVLDSMAEGVIAVDKGQRVVFVNDSACRMFRFQQAGAIGRPIWDVVRSPKLQQWSSEALASTEPIGGELELLSPATRLLAVRAVGLPARTASGAIIVVSDISELRRLEGVRREFVANASHELKTPLASIKACVETLLDGAIDDLENRVRFLNTANEQTDRLDKLIRDLMSLTRIESEGMQKNPRPTSLDDVADVCLERHRHHAERKGLQLIHRPANSATLILADEESLEQILDNLLDNAIKYTDAGGSVTLRWQTIDRTCMVDVEDTGIGIPQGQLARIFERFYRVDRARSRDLGGTGLGLSIVKHLAQSLGATVSVQSRLDKGSTFSVTFKLAGQVLEGQPAGPVADPATEGQHAG